MYSNKIVELTLFPKLFLVFFCLSNLTLMLILILKSLKLLKSLKSYVITCKLLRTDILRHLSSDRN